MPRILLSQDVARFGFVGTSQVMFGRRVMLFSSYSLHLVLLLASACWHVVGDVGRRALQFPFRIAIPRVVPADLVHLSAFTYGLLWDPPPSHPPYKSPTSPHLLSQSLQSSSSSLPFQGFQFQVVDGRRFCFRRSPIAAS
ncbi:hypothetical protein L6452_26264 [Arctium lappa]|uniref:Uncharacterized protein n=1 Tax=Arctium lappa TaxID=4217 RepID=A0ACB9ACP7_ARCLA|nr:hypothetical protein L6452_26264 [Arctium lappa]